MTALSHILTIVLPFRGQHVLMIKIVELKTILGTAKLIIPNRIGVIPIIARIIALPVYLFFLKEGSISCLS